MDRDFGQLRLRPRIGLALGGGVARGWAHIGVLRGLRRYGIVPDIIAGSSVGALVGGFYLAGHLQTLEDWARQLNKLKIVGYLDLRLASGGLIAGTKLINEMRRHLGDLRIEDLAIPFVAIATDLATGHEVWLREGSVVDSLRASFSLPGVFPPMMVDGRYLIDGALVDPVPVSACRSMGAEMVIAVNLAGDLIGKSRRIATEVPVAGGFDLMRLLEEQAAAAMPLSPLNALTRRLFNRDPGIPSLFGVMVSSLGIIIDRVTRMRLAGDPPDVHIAPRLGHIGLLEFDRAEEMIVEGEAAVERAVPELMDALTVFSHGARESVRGDMTG
ncbi:MAG: lysophospholipase [Azospirillum sp.]|nr:lysophospholipase [Azospirillum sp.]